MLIIYEDNQVDLIANDNYVAVNITTFVFCLIHTYKHTHM